MSSGVLQFAIFWVQCEMSNNQYVKTNVHTLNVVKHHQSNTQRWDGDIYNV